MEIGYIGVYIMLAAVFAWVIGTIVTENVWWCIPWVLIAFGAGFVVTWVDIIVSLL